ncbi:hypothetical protein SAMN02910317_03244 [Ruminococcaceae bacterium FB2012]|nr:hypothetical protein SAMN02910317_03244 [Ruminococcaceae bacterium FB2012]
MLGYVGSSYGAGRLLMKFPGVYNKPFMSTYYTIDSAKLYFKEQSGLTGNTALLVYNYTGSGSWDETSVYSSALWNNVGGVYGSASFSGSDVIFDITAPVRSWQTNVSNTISGLLASWLNNTFPNKWRGVSSYNSYLYPDEYLVCLRVGKNSDRWDYHFWFRASNGKWYDKHGWNSYEECLQYRWPLQSLLS